MKVRFTSMTYKSNDAIDALKLLMSIAIVAIVGKDKIVLLCYEVPGKFCQQTCGGGLVKRRVGQERN